MAKPAHAPETFEPAVLRRVSNAALRRALLAWYATHRRDLPWRHDRDPYRVWVSEIMLQQTRVAAVLEHYRRFLEAFPTIAALASAPVDRVLALWSGLGYYRRARLLHQAARQVCSELGGEIPHTAATLRELPGVGRYTAAAVASIAHGEPVAVVDGNVERVLSRLDGAARSGAALWLRAQELLDPRHPGDWNQAIMELGATVCTVQSPQCPVCPLRPWCRTLGAGPRQPQPARKRLSTTRALIQRAHRIYLVQRPADVAKMAGMWELPELTASAAEPPPEAVLCTVRHSITDTDYRVRVLRLPLKLLPPAGKRAGRWVPCDQIFALPLTGLTRKILHKLGFPAASGGR
jgi:A/G-specific adenine glycosylase